MEQLKGYEVHVEIPSVYKLQKSFMGLCNLLKSGVEYSMDRLIRSQSYDRSNEVSNLYTKECIDDSYVILILHIDGMLIIGKNKDELNFLT
mgnify:CR=1 FL=1